MVNQVIKPSFSWIVPLLIMIHIHPLAQFPPTLWRAQAIVILQRAAALGWGFSFLSHIIPSAPSSQVDLCQITAFFFLS